jgi:alanine dehydrogenase
VAGAYAVDLIATKFNINLGGPGQRLEGYPGLDSVSPAKVLVLGGGTAGTSAAFQLLLRGASVFITEVKPVRIAFLSEFLGREIFDKFQTSRSLGRRNFLEIVIPKSFEEDQPNISPEIIKDLCVRADAVIGAPYIPAANAPKILTRQMRAEINAARLALGRPGLVIVDIATDQGGCVEVSEGIHSSHEYPWFQDDFGNFICNIPNMPGGFPLTSSEALAASIANPLITLAKLPFREALLKCPELIWGINTLSGMLTVKAVADFHHLSYTPVFEALQKAETGFDLVAFQQLEFGQIYQDISTGGNPDWKNITPNLLGQPCRCTFERGKTQLHFTLG